MRTMLGRWQTWAGFAVAAVLLFGVAPAVLSDFRLSLLGKFLCFAIVAVGIGLAWGRGGMLVLGQGVFFGLGGYMMGMHLKIADAEIRHQAVPDFMQIAGVRELPGYWTPFASPSSPCWPSWSSRPGSPHFWVSACLNDGSRAPISRSCRRRSRPLWRSCSSGRPAWVAATG